MNPQLVGFFMLTRYLYMDNNLKVFIYEKSNTKIYEIYK